MKMIDAIRSAYLHSFTLHGRATRSEYWWFWLYQSLVYLLLLAVCISSSVYFQDNNGYSFILIGIFGILNVVPNFTIMVRRLHDSSKSGWWLLLFLLSGPGALILFIFTLLPSEGDNKYGLCPYKSPMFGRD